MCWMIFDGKNAYSFYCSKDELILVLCIIHEWIRFYIPIKDLQTGNSSKRHKSVFSRNFCKKEMLNWKLLYILDFPSPSCFHVWMTKCLVYMHCTYIQLEIIAQVPGELLPPPGSWGGQGDHSWCSHRQSGQQQKQQRRRLGGTGTFSKV